MNEKLTALFQKAKNMILSHKAVSAGISCGVAFVIVVGAVAGVLLNQPSTSLVDTSTSPSSSDGESELTESELDSALSIEEGAEVSTVTNQDGTTTQVITHTDGTVTEVTTNSDGSQSVSVTDSKGNTSTVTRPSGSSGSSSTAKPDTRSPTSGSSSSSSSSSSSAPESKPSQPDSSSSSSTPSQPESSTSTPESKPDLEPEPGYPPFDANTVINRAVSQIKEFMTLDPEAPGNYGYFTFTFGLDETMDEIVQGLVELYQGEQRRNPSLKYFYIEYAGVMHDGESYNGVTYVGSQPGHWFFLYRG